ncbi:MAG: TlpA family protein disulfide reductase [Propionibacteriaceae bacterium]|nr:TlpA family protein disulfide reductase [Propionibacteriaceae bacterium]
MKNANVRTAIILAITTLLVLTAIFFIRQPWIVNSPIEVEIADEVASGPLREGHPAPQFTAETVDKSVFNLQDLQGKPVWLIFEATWCGACAEEIEAVQETYAEYQDKVHVVSIFVEEDTRKVIKHQKSKNLRHPLIADHRGKLTGHYSVYGIPKHVFIDSQGVVVTILEGTLTKDEASAILNDLS